MNLREAYESVPERVGGKRCVTCSTLASLPDDDAATLRELLDDRAVSSSIIAEACKRAGYPQLTEGTLKRHRRGDCRGSLT
jgi:hypothetical protein